MQPWQMRVGEERKQLSDRLLRLNAVLDQGPENHFGAAEVRRLERQRLIMRLYLDVLDERIAAWEDGDR